MRQTFHKYSHLPAEKGLRKKERIKIFANSIRLEKTLYLIEFGALESKHEVTTLSLPCKVCRRNSVCVYPVLFMTKIGHVQYFFSMDICNVIGFRVYGFCKIN